MRTTAHPAARPAVGRSVLAGVVGLAALATAGTLAMVSAGTRMLSTPPSQVLAGGAPADSWGSGRVLLPATAAPRSPAVHPVLRAGTGTGHRALVVARPARPARPVMPVAPVLGPPTVIAPPAPPLPTPTPGRGGAGSSPGRPALHGDSAEPTAPAGDDESRPRPDGERDDKATRGAHKRGTAKSAKSAKPGKHLKGEHRKVDRAQRKHRADHDD